MCSGMAKQIRWGEIRLRKACVAGARARNCITLMARARGSLRRLPLNAVITIFVKPTQSLSQPLLAPETFSPDVAHSLDLRATRQD